ncbi:MAG: NAD-dependent epimerase/dehydratase family protein [Lysobacter sp.]|nr:NAD-dependent epimerase/dehydratase family protein [Lysobacter sp.]
MKIVVLGGGGFLGSHAIARLRSEGHEAISVVRRPRGDAHERVCDLFAADAPLMDLLAGADVCLHLAGDLVPGSAENAGWPGYLRNVQLASSLADACCVAGVGRLVFASSGGTIYGADVVGAREDMACHPIGLYGAQKLAIEALLRARLTRTDCRLMVLRIGNPFGVGQESQRAHGVIGRIFHSMSKGGEFAVWGDGTQVRDYVHVSDVAHAFARSLAYEGPLDLFNIGSGKGVDTDHLIRMCTDVSGISLQYAYRPKAVYEVDRISLDIGLAASELDWMPSLTLEQGLAQYFEQLVEMK